MNTRKNWLDSFYSTNSNNINNSYYTREETISDVQENFNIRRYNSTEGYEVECEGIRDWVLIQSHSNPLNEKKEDKKMHFPLNFNVQRGSIIKWLKYDEDWLAMSKVDSVGDAYKSVQIDRCNNTLKYNYNGVNINVPCIIEEDTNMTLDNNTIPTPHSYFIVTISENTETNKIPLGARLIFKNSVYKLIGNNDIANVGLLKFRIALDEKRIGLDDFTNKIADNTGLKTDNFSINIINGDFSARVGDTVQLNVQLLNSGNIEPSTLSQFNFVSSDTNIATIDENGLITVITEGTCQITCSLKENSSITSSINITAINNIVTTNITYNLTPNSSMGNVIKKSNTNTFTAHKYDNDIEIATTFDFDINYNGLSASAISIVEKTSTYVKVKNISVDTSNPLKTIFVLYREVGQTEWLSQEVILKGIYG